MEGNEKTSAVSVPTFTTHRRPLIESCTNEWQRNPQIYQEAQYPPRYSDSECIEDFWCWMDRFAAIAKAPKFRRFSAIFVFIVIMSVMAWRLMLGKYVAETEAVIKSMNDIIPQKGTFGVNMRVHFPDIKQVDTLDRKYLPRQSRIWPGGNKGRRLIFIGDIHGCKDELHTLLQKVHYNEKLDHIIATGDMINKGPHSTGVVDFLMRQGASCVRGNHEDRILLTAHSLTNTNVRKGEVVPSDEVETEGQKKSKHEKALASSFSKAQLKWLASCPVILKVGEIGSFGQVVVVHGGLVPGLSLESQDPSSVMNMRVIDLKTHMPSKKHEKDGSVPWYEYWNHYQRLIPAQNSVIWRKKNKSHNSEKPSTVVYGHDSKRGLQINGWSKGLDSGCVNGGKLTAWVVGDFGSEKIVHVPDLLPSGFQPISRIKRTIMEDTGQSAEGTTQKRPLHLARQPSSDLNTGETNAFPAYASPRPEAIRASTGFPRSWNFRFQPPDSADLIPDQYRPPSHQAYAKQLYQNIALHDPKVRVAADFEGEGTASSPGRRGSQDPGYLRSPKSKRSSQIYGERLQRALTQPERTDPSSPEPVAAALHSPPLQPDYEAPIDSEDDPLTKIVAEPLVDAGIPLVTDFFTLEQLDDNCRPRVKKIRIVLAEDADGKVIHRLLGSEEEVASSIEDITYADADDVDPEYLQHCVAAVLATNKHLQHLLLKWRKYNSDLTRAAFVMDVPAVPSMLSADQLVDEIRAVGIKSDTVKEENRVLSLKNYIEKQGGLADSERLSAKLSTAHHSVATANADVASARGHMRGLIEENIRLAAAFKSTWQGLEDIQIHDRDTGLSATTYGSLKKSLIQPDSLEELVDSSSLAEIDKLRFILEENAVLYKKARTQADSLLRSISAQQDNQELLMTVSLLPRGEHGTAYKPPQVHIPNTLNVTMSRSDTDLSLRNATQANVSQDHKPRSRTRKPPPAPIMLGSSRAELRPYIAPEFVNGAIDLAHDEENAGPASSRLPNGRRFTGRGVTWDFEARATTSPKERRATFSKETRRLPIEETLDVEERGQVIADITCRNKLGRAIAFAAGDVVRVYTRMTGSRTWAVVHERSSMHDVVSMPRDNVAFVCSCPAPYPYEGRYQIPGDVKGGSGTLPLERGSTVLVAHSQPLGDCSTAIAGDSYPPDELWCVLVEATRERGWVSRSALEGADLILSPVVPAFHTKNIQSQRCPCGYRYSGLGRIRASCADSKSGLTFQKGQKVRLAYCKIPQNWCVQDLSSHLHGTIERGRIQVLQIPWESHLNHDFNDLVLALTPRWAQRGFANNEVYSPFVGIEKYDRWIPQAELSPSLQKFYENDKRLNPDGKPWRAPNSLKENIGFPFGVSCCLHPSEGTYIRRGHWQSLPAVVRSVLPPTSLSQLGGHRRRRAKSCSQVFSISDHGKGSCYSSGRKPRRSSLPLPHEAELVKRTLEVQGTPRQEGGKGLELLPFDVDLGPAGRQYWEHLRRDPDAWGYRHSYENIWTGLEEDARERTLGLCADHEFLRAELDRRLAHEPEVKYPWEVAEIRKMHHARGAHIHDETEIQSNHDESVIEAEISNVRSWLYGGICLAFDFLPPDPSIATPANDWTNGDALQIIGLGSDNITCTAYRIWRGLQRELTIYDPGQDYTLPLQYLDFRRPKLIVAKPRPGASMDDDDYQPYQLTDYLVLIKRVGPSLWDCYSFEHRLQGLVSNDEIDICEPEGWCSAAQFLGSVPLFYHGGDGKGGEEEDKGKEEKAADGSSVEEHTSLAVSEGLPASKIDFAESGRYFPQGNAYNDDLEGIQHIHSISGYDGSISPAHVHADNRMHTLPYPHVPASGPDQSDISWPKSSDSPSSANTTASPNATTSTGSDPTRSERRQRFDEFQKTVEARALRHGTSTHTSPATPHAAFLRLNSMPRDASTDTIAPPRPNSRPGTPAVMQNSFSLRPNMSLIGPQRTQLEVCQPSGRQPLAQHSIMSDAGTQTLSESSTSLFQDPRKKEYVQTEWESASDDENPHANRAQAWVQESRRPVKTMSKRKKSQRKRHREDISRSRHASAAENDLRRLPRTISTPAEPESLSTNAIMQQEPRGHVTARSPLTSSKELEIKPLRSDQASSQPIPLADAKGDVKASAKICEDIVDTLSNSTIKTEMPRELALSIENRPSQWQTSKSARTPHHSQSEDIVRAPEDLEGRAPTTTDIDGSIDLRHGTSESRRRSAESLHRQESSSPTELSATPSNLEPASSIGHQQTTPGRNTSHPTIMADRLYVYICAALILSLGIAVGNLQQFGLRIRSSLFRSSSITSPPEVSSDDEETVEKITPSDREEKRRPAHIESFPEVWNEVQDASKSYDQLTPIPDNALQSVRRPAINKSRLYQDDLEDCINAPLAVKESETRFLELTPKPQKSKVNGNDPLSKRRSQAMNLTRLQTTVDIPLERTTDMTTACDGPSATAKREFEYEQIPSLPLNASPMEREKRNEALAQRGLELDAMIEELISSGSYRRNSAHLTTPSKIAGPREHHRVAQKRRATPLRSVMNMSSRPVTVDLGDSAVKSLTPAYREPVLDGKENHQDHKSRNGAIDLPEIVPSPSLREEIGPLEDILSRIENDRYSSKFSILPLRYQQSTVGQGTKQLLQQPPDFLRRLSAPEASPENAVQSKVADLPAPLENHVDGSIDDVDEDETYYVQGKPVYPHASDATQLWRRSTIKYKDLSPASIDSSRETPLNRPGVSQKSGEMRSKPGLVLKSSQERPPQSFQKHDVLDREQTPANSPLSDLNLALSGLPIGSSYITFERFHDDDGASAAFDKPYHIGNRDSSHLSEHERRHASLVSDDTNELIWRNPQDKNAKHSVYDSTPIDAAYFLSDPVQEDELVPTFFHRSRYSDESSSIDVHRPKGQRHLVPSSNADDDESREQRDAIFVYPPYALGQNGAGYPVFTRVGNDYAVSTTPLDEPRHIHDWSTANIGNKRQRPVSWSSEHVPDDQQLHQRDVESRSSPHQSAPASRPTPTPEDHRILKSKFSVKPQHRKTEKDPKPRPPQARRPKQVANAPRRRVIFRPPYLLAKSTEWQTDAINTTAASSTTTNITAQSQLSPPTTGENMQGPTSTAASVSPIADAPASTDEPPPTAVVFEAYPSIHTSREHPARSKTWLSKTSLTNLFRNQAPTYRAASSVLTRSTIRKTRDWLFLNRARLFAVIYIYLLISTYLARQEWRSANGAARLRGLGPSRGWDDVSEQGYGRARWTWGAGYREKVMFEIEKYIRSRVEWY